MQIIFLFIFYVLQTTWLARLLPVRLDLILILFILCISNKGLLKGLGWGIFLGFFLDMFTSYNYFYMLSYPVIGGLLGLIPGDFFQSYRILVVTNTLLASLLIFGFAGLYGATHLISLSLPFLSSLYVLVLNCLAAYLLANPLAKFFGINVKYQ